MKKIKDFINYQIRGRLYRLIMRVAHRNNWHYAPPIFPDRDIQLWCKWCGFRDSYDGEHHKWNKDKGLVELRFDVIEKEMTEELNKRK